MRNRRLRNVSTSPSSNCVCIPHSHRPRTPRTPRLLSVPHAESLPVHASLAALGANGRAHRIAAIDLVVAGTAGAPQHAVLPRDGTDVTRVAYPRSAQTPVAALSPQTTERSRPTARHRLLMGEVRSPRSDANLVHHDVLRPRVWVTIGSGQPSTSRGGGHLSIFCSHSSRSSLICRSCGAGQSHTRPLSLLPE